MEPNQDDPGSDPRVLHMTEADTSKEVLAKRILDEYVTVFCALMRKDPRLKDTQEFVVPETGAIPVQPPKRRPILKRNRKVEVPLATKQCWKIDDLFDARADTAQALFVATDGTPYCSFAKLGRENSYVEVTKEFLLTQSSSTLIIMRATLQDKLQELLQQRNKSA